MPKASIRSPITCFSPLPAYIDETPSSRRAASGRGIYSRWGRVFIRIDGGGVGPQSNGEKCLPVGFEGHRPALSIGFVVGLRFYLAPLVEGLIRVCDGELATGKQLIVRDRPQPDEDFGSPVSIEVRA